MLTLTFSDRRVNATGAFWCGDACLSSPCRNGGRCLDTAANASRYNCSCRKGFVGSNCEVDVNECSGPSQCANKGQCSESSAWSWVARKAAKPRLALHGAHS